MEMKKKKRAADTFDLPEDIFIGSDEPEEVSRLEHLRDTKLNNLFLLYIDRSFFKSSRTH